MLLPPALGFSPHLPVSVCGTGWYHTIAAFLDSPFSGFATLVRSPSRVRLTVRFCLYSSYPAWPGLCSPGSGYVPVSRPSPTTFVLSLGPDLPRADQLYSGILGYSAMMIPTSFSLLIPAFSLLSTPLLLIGTASTRWDCSSTNVWRHSWASVSCFSPGNFRRRTSRPVSYYALFECVAASEPTSWLSSKSHILFHLTRTLGP